MVHHPKSNHQQFTTGQRVRYIGGDTGGAYAHGDILEITRRRGGEFYEARIVASSRPDVVGKSAQVPPNVIEALPAGGRLSPASFRALGRERVASETPRLSKRR